MKNPISFVRENTISSMIVSFIIIIAWMLTKKEIGEFSPGYISPTTYVLVTWIANLLAVLYIYLGSLKVLKNKKYKDQSILITHITLLIIFTVIAYWKLSESQYWLMRLVIVNTILLIIYLVVIVINSIKSLEGSSNQSEEIIPASSHPWYGNDNLKKRIIESNEDLYRKIKNSELVKTKVLIHPARTYPYNLRIQVVESPTGKEIKGLMLRLDTGTYEVFNGEVHKVLPNYVFDFNIGKIVKLNN